MPIRVLMVTDADGSYHEEGQRFGLTELVKALEEGGCAVTKAHRYAASDPHSTDAQIKSFKFDNPAHFKPDDFDEVWLMGFGSSNPAGPYGDPAQYAMTNAEINVLAKFMNGGGGIFATGDHDDLGADLCAKVPRVRSMRRWEADYGWMQLQNDLDSFTPGPNKSPPPVGQYRLDTLMTGHNSHFEFQDQSDDVPQEIDPVMHVIRSHASHVAGGTIGYSESMPHPLLCGPNGIVNVLPDHMHEGRCLVPDDLTKTFMLDGAPTDEYPKLSNGARVSPEVVAWATVGGRKRDPNFTDPQKNYNQFGDSNTNVHADYYPVIVAYNGHRAKIGRVVVDATFHHFVNVNVTGVKAAFANEADPVDAIKAQGFPASAAGQAHYEQIKTYWRNIAHWISRPSVIRGIAWNVFSRVALDPRLKQTTPLGQIDRIPAGQLVRYGASAWTLMTQAIAPCKVISWTFDIAIPDPLSMLLAPWVYIHLTLPDPPPELRVRTDLAADKLELLFYALGAMMLGLRQPEVRASLMAGKLDEQQGMAIVRQAATTGLLRGLREQAGRMERTVGALKQAIQIGTEQQRQ